MKLQRAIGCTALLAITTLSLTHCSMYHWANKQMAHAAMQHRELKDGSTVTIGTNMAPTKAWHCHRLVRNYQIDRGNLERWSVFSIGGEEKLLADKAVAYANKHHIKANYINLHTASHQVVSERASNNKSEQKQDHTVQPQAAFYRCDTINPKHQLGVSRRQDKQFTSADAST